jgi:hypothetical protein
MLLRFVLVLVLAVSSASCSGPCTLIGCQSAVAVTLATAELQTLGEGMSEIRVCIDTSCTQETVDGSTGNFATGQFELNGAVLRAARNDASSISRAAVSLTITREGSERFTRTWQNVTFAGQSPNGPGCGEACRVASVDATTP